MDAPSYVLDFTRVSTPGRQRKAITGPADVWQLLKRRIAKREKENFVLVLLDARHAVIGTEIISVGTLNASLVHPREVFRPAIIGNAASIILAHNHPSGSSTPSDDDVAVTRRLVQVGEMHGIPVLDHIIVCQSSYSSFREGRLLGVTCYFTLVAGRQREQISKPFRFHRTTVATSPYRTSDSSKKS